jgi:hypothetical protein
MPVNNDEWQYDRSMSPRGYERTILALGLNQSSAGRYLGVSARTSRRYLSGDAAIPAVTVLFLRSCLAHKVKPVVPKLVRGKRQN